MSRHVLEQEDGIGVLDLRDVVERGQRVLRAGDHRSVYAIETARERPLEEGKLQIGGHFHEQRTDAILLNRLDSDQRMKREHETLQIVDGIAVRHRRGSLTCANEKGAARTTRGAFRRKRGGGAATGSGGVTAAEPSTARAACAARA